MIDISNPFLITAREGCMLCPDSATTGHACINEYQHIHIATLLQQQDTKSREDEGNWKRHIIDAAVVSWTFTKEHETDPHAAINALLCQAQIEALDPTISKEAQDLQQKTRIKVLEEVLKAKPTDCRDYYHDACSCIDDWLEAIKILKTSSEEK